MASEDVESMQRLISEIGSKKTTRKVVTCEHDFRHLSGWNKVRGSSFVRIDHFHCTRCLEISEVRREFQERPEWWE